MALKSRIIPILLCKGRELVKGTRFHNNRRVGNVISACKVHNMRGVDELCLLDVGDGRFDLSILDVLASECFMPLTVGGGIDEIDWFQEALRRGADKIVLGENAQLFAGYVEAAARKFGNQAVVAHIAYSNGMSPVEWAKHAEERGAGEILLTSRERDGTLEGYDYEAIKAVSSAVSIPVIACGGCGKYDDMAAALSAGAHAVAAGAMFQFTDATPQGAAKYLRDCGFNTRVDNAA